MPYKPVAGRYLEFKALYNQASGAGADSYRAFQARFPSYHQLADELILACA